MKNVDGKMMSQEEINLEFVLACNMGDLAKVVKYVDGYGADVESMDKSHYAKALVYALRSCDGEGSEGELIVKYLVNHGATVNFKHGDKQTHYDSRPYFIYWAADNPNQVSDDLVEFLIEKGAKRVLDYKPTTKSNNLKSASEIIKCSRPKLYAKLVKKNIIKDSRR